MAHFRSFSKLLPKPNLSFGTRYNNSTSSNILKSPYSDINKTNDNINDYMWLNLDKWHNKIATICALTGRSYTYAQTHKHSLTFAASLRAKIRLRDNDNVAVIMPNTPEYPSVVLGILQAGCVVSPMNPAYTTDELKHQLALTDCKAVVTSKLFYPKIMEALNDLQVKIPIILIDNEGLPEGTIKFSEFADDVSIDKDCLKSVRRSSNDLAVLPFSSGTTGIPKGVALTHANLVAMIQMISDPEIKIKMETSADYQTVSLAIIPFFHIFGFSCLMLYHMQLGYKIVTMPYFKPEFLLQTIGKHQVNVIPAVPPIMLFLGKHPAVTPKHIESLGTIISGAAPLSENDITAVINKNKTLDIRQGYGITETSGGVSLGKLSCNNHQSSGHPFPSCEVKIVDLDTQEALPPGKDGEIWFRGPNQMLGYYKNEAATKEVITEDGWFKTGDIGNYDENKFLYVTDRLKELIKVKGLQVAPAELEAIMRSHPKISDCAVLGVPDSMTGETPKAFIVTHPGQNLLPEEIKDFVNSKVAVFKRISTVQFVEEIPKNPAGKILRKDLRAKYC